MALVRNHPNYSKFRMKIGHMMDFSGSSWIYQETPSGVMNGDNINFFIKKRPIENTESVFKDGMLMARGLDYVMDYPNKLIRFTRDANETVVENGLTVTKVKKGQVPQSDSVIRVDYKYEIE